MEIMKNRNKEKEKKIWKKTEVEIAVNSLSYSESEAVKLILNELDSNKDIIVASNLAENLEVSPAIVSGSLDILESSRVIETHSLGRKGTHVEVLNEFLLGVGEEL